MSQTVTIISLALLMKQINTTITQLLAMNPWAWSRFLKSNVILWTDNWKVPIVKNLEIFNKLITYWMFYWPLPPFLCNEYIFTFNFLSHFKKWWEYWKISIERTKCCFWNNIIPIRWNCTLQYFKYHFVRGTMHSKINLIRSYEKKVQS